MIFGGSGLTCHYTQPETPRPYPRFKATLRHCRATRQCPSKKSGGLMVRT